MKILVVRIDHLGDVLLTTPLIRALSRAGHEVDVLVRKPMDALLAGSPHVHKIWLLDDVAPGFPAGWRVLGRWMKSLACGAVLLPNARPKQLAWAAAMSGARHRLAMWGGLWGRLAGLRCLRSGFAENPRHFADILLDMARALGAEPDGLRPDYFPTDAEKAAARESLRTRFGELPVIGIHPGCMGNTCNLPASVYGGVAELLLNDGRFAVVATGVASEKPLLDAWPRAVLEHHRFFPAMGAWSIRELAAHVSLFRAVVVTGTGPLHLASALGVPVAAPFCADPSLCPTVWGSLVEGSEHVMPDAAYCHGRHDGGRGHCDFGGRISAARLYEACVRAAGFSLAASGTHSTSPC